MNIRQTILRLQNTLQGRSSFSKKKIEWKDFVFNLFDILLEILDELEKIELKVRKMERKKDLESRVIDLENQMKLFHRKIMNSSIRHK